MIDYYFKHDSPEQNLLEQEKSKFLSPFQRKLLQKHLETDLRSEYRRRIEIMLLADRGHSQTEICAALNCAQETARYWMFMARTGQAHKWKELSVGRPKTIDEKYLARLQELVSYSPQQFGYAFSRWTAQWLSKHLAKELGIKISDRHINRLLKKMGLSTRYKPSPTEKTAEPEQTESSAIVIGNLSSTARPKSVDFSLFST
ncbi:helix-turn-helix domain-containing protein [Pleurocapsales cyanobacterium LEGE 06147]|nr:helix-turn-helix domain-containing protein [Pleurocapsales cyanobacterium LEGE 06147]